MIRDQLDMNDTKICTKCGQKKSTSDFSKRKVSYKPQCKVCEKERRQEAYRNRKDIILKNSKKFRDERVAAGKTLPVCKILKKHHEETKGDPEHLTCDFLKKIIGVECKHERI